MSDNDPEQSAPKYPIIDQPPEHAIARAAGEAARSVIAPGADVPVIRREVRASIGDADAPMVEIDGSGQVVFVGGDWQALTGHTKPGALALDVLLAGVNDAAATREAIVDAMESRATALFAHTSRLGERRLKVVPIPSPRVAGRLHALVGLGHDDSVAAPVPMSLARHEVSAGDVAAVEARRRAGARIEEPDAAADTAAASATRGSGPAAADSSGRRKAGPTARPTRRRVAVPAPVVAHSDAPPTVAELDAQRRHLAPASTASAASPGAKRRDRLLLGGIVVALYIAFQGLYLGPIYDWPSPLGGLLDSGACLVQPLCDNEVVRANHIGVLALAASLVGVVLLFGRKRPEGVHGARPIEPATLSATSWQPSFEGPGLFLWLSIAALLLVVLQTMLGGAASVGPWLAAIGLGAVAAWRADRDAQRALGSTMGALAFAVGTLLVVVGVGALWLGERLVVALVLLGLGAALVGWATRLIEAGRSSFDRADVFTMLGLALVALVLGLVRHHSWRYAFIGDEWTFFEGAFDGLRENPTLDTFGIGGPNDYFTGLTFELQGAVMRVAGENVWGWRLSALLPMVLSVPAMYAFTRWLAGRTAAVAAAVTLAASHMLLSFSMVPYNNSQSLVAVSASLAALAWAHQRPSAVRFFVLGAAVGSTFIVYAMARLALLPVGLLFVVLFRAELASMWRRIAWSTLGALAVAAPALFSWENWQALLKATPVEAEQNVRDSGVLRQVVENTIGGWLSFIASTRNTHYIVGPHLDVLSAALLIVGLGYAVVQGRRDPAMRWFLVGGVGLWTLINAIQQYAQISNTRSFMVPLVLCVFVGLGVHALLPRVLRLVGARRTVGNVGAALAVLTIAVVGLNQWHISGHANERQQLTEQALVVQQLEFTESVAGHGMPTYIAWPEERNGRLTMVLRAHDIAPDRIVVVPAGGEIDRTRLCGTAEPLMVLVHRNDPRLDEWKRDFEQCWGQPAVEVRDPFGDPKLLRFTNDAGAAEFDLAPSDRFRRDEGRVVHRLADVVDVAVDGSGRGFALVRTGSGGSIHRLDGGGSFELSQQVPVDFDITADGHFVVAGAGTDDRLVWYDGAGNRVARFAGSESLPTIGGLAVSDDRLWLSDTVNARVVAVAVEDRELRLVDQRSGARDLVEPAGVAPGPDDSVWVFSAGGGQIVRIDADDQAVARLPAQNFSPVDAPRLASTADGYLVRPVPERPEIQLVAADGTVVDERGGLIKPIAAAPDSGSTLVASDARWQEQPVLHVDERWQAPPDRGVVAWGQEQPLATGFVDYGDPFVAPPPATGPIEVDFTDTEFVDSPAGHRWREVGAAQLASTHALDVGDGFAAIADTAGRVARLGLDGEPVELFGVGTGSSHISDLVIDERGVIWLLDAGMGALHRVDLDGTVLTVQPEGAPLGNARGIGLARDGGTWVAATAAAGVARIDGAGVALEAVALTARQPTDVVELADGTLWIVDGEQYALVHVARDGTELDVLALEQFSSFESPHLALSGDTLWVTAPEQSQLLAVDLATATYRDLAIELARPDASRVDKAIGIGVTPSGDLWVTDSNAHALALIDPQT